MGCDGYLHGSNALAEWPGSAGIVLLRVHSHFLGLQIQDFLVFFGDAASIEGNAIDYLLKVHSHFSNSEHC